MSRQIFKDKDTVAEVRAARAAEAAREAWLYKPDMAEGEVLLWRGRPKRGVTIHFLSTFERWIWVIYLCWWAFDVVRLLQQPAWRQTGLRWFAELFPFLVIGLFLFGGALIRSRRTYVVTNRRVMQIDRLFATRIKSVELTPSAHVEAVSDGAWISKIRVANNVRYITMFGVKDEARVIELLRQQQRLSLRATLLSAIGQ